MYCIILSNTITKNPKKTAEVNIEIVERDLKGDGYIWFFFCPGNWFCVYSLCDNLLI